MIYIKYFSTIFTSSFLVFQEKKLLVEGPLNNLKESPIHLAKPKALVNSTNPVSVTKTFL